jgi:hypothetical protein
MRDSSEDESFEAQGPKGQRRSGRDAIGEGSSAPQRSSAHGTQRSTAAATTVGDTSENEASPALHNDDPEDGTLSAAPISFLGEANPSSEAQSAPNENIICCPCKTDIDSDEMICCDQCGTWQHFHCVNLDKNSKQVRDVAAAYLCPECTRDLPAQRSPSPPVIQGYVRESSKERRSSQFSSDDDVVRVTRKGRRPGKGIEHARRSSDVEVASPKGKPLSAPMGDSESDDVPLSRKGRTSKGASQMRTGDLADEDSFFGNNVVPPPDRRRTLQRRRQPPADDSDPEDAFPSAPTADQEPSEDVPVARRQRAARKPAATKQLKRVLSDQANDEMQSPALLALDAITSEHSAITSNIARWNRAIGPEGAAIKLHRVVLPIKMTGRVSHMRDLLRAPVVDNRRLWIKACSLANPSATKPGRPRAWHYMIRDSNRPKEAAMKVNGQFYNDRVLPTKQEAEKVGRKLCQYLERLPGPFTLAKAATGKPTAMAGLLQVAIFADLYENTDWLSTAWPESEAGSPAGFHTIHVQGKKVTGDTPIISDKGPGGTYKEQNLNVGIRPEQLDMTVDIPESDCDVGAFWPKIFNEESLRKDPKVPEAQYAQYIKAAEIVRYVQVQMYGAIGGWQDIHKLKESLLRPFLLEKHRANISGIETFKYRGPYENKKLLFYSQFRANKEFVVKASESLAADVEGRLPDVRIKGGSKTRVAFVIQTLHAVFYATGDILQAWRTACDLADRVCANLITSEEIKLQYCQCSDDKERSKTTHTCQFCLNEELCDTLQLNEQSNMICKNCFENISKTDEYNFDPGERLLFRLTCLITADKSIPKADRKTVIEAIWAEVQKYRTSDGKWQDLWADEPREEYVESGRAKAPHPLSLSFDAILPISISNGKVEYHANPNNMCLTATWINRLKGLFFPMLLGYMRMVEEMRSGPPGQDYSTIIDQLDHFYVKSQAYKFVKKTERGEMDSEKAQMIIEQMKQPIASQHDANSAFKVPKLSIDHDKNKGWSSAECNTIDTIIAQAEQRYPSSKKIPRGPDGSPWIWIPLHMPTDWSWHHLWRLIAGRMTRMRYLCNAKWETIDNTVTLFLECVLQYLKFGGKDEFFGAPMTIYVKHALIFSIGHRRHGEQMRTGFKTPYPQDLDDYDESISNICFETHLANHVKWNHSESEYEIIHEDLRKVHLNTDYYSVPNDCPRFNFNEIFARGTHELVDEDIEDSDNESDHSDNEWLDDDDPKVLPPDNDDELS